MERSLGDLAGGDRGIDSISSVGGGCISPGARIVTDRGRTVFLKWAEPDSAPADFFAEEARSLRRLGDTEAVRVPAVLDVSRNWLLLEWLESGRAGSETWPALGRALARMHGTAASSFGWPADNYIGTLPQRNDVMTDWPSFWMERRIGPQWERARGRGFFDRTDQRAVDRLAADAPGLLEAGNADGPSLLHGDLWGGNVHILEDGTAALIDPSSSYGHREVDLAMARLFGGFDPAFFQAYDEARPIEPGFSETRCPLYQLYYLLVHVNLFGATYVGQSRSVLRPFA